MATKKFSEYAIEGQNVTLTYDNVNDTVTFDVVVDKNDVGLGNVDNTSDVNKPISSATQTALNEKQDTLVSGTNIKTVNGEDILGSGDISIPTYIARHDFQNTYDYLGKALTGSSESSNVWTITRLTLSPNGSATIGTATSVAWTNRYSVIYT